MRNSPGACEVSCRVRARAARPASTPASPQGHRMVPANGGSPTPARSVRGDWGDGRTRRPPAATRRSPGEPRVEERLPSSGTRGRTAAALGGMRPLFPLLVAILETVLRAHLHQNFMKRWTAREGAAPVVSSDVPRVMLAHAPSRHSRRAPSCCTSCALATCGSELSLVREHAVWWGGVRQWVAAVVGVLVAVRAGEGSVGAEQDGHVVVGVVAVPVAHADPGVLA